MVWTGQVTLYPSTDPNEQRALLAFSWEFAPGDVLTVSRNVDAIPAAAVDRVAILQSLKAEADARLALEQDKRTREGTLTAAVNTWLGNNP